MCILYKIKRLKLLHSYFCVFSGFSCPFFIIKNYKFSHFRQNNNLIKYFDPKILPPQKYLSGCQSQLSIPTKIPHLTFLRPEKLTKPSTLSSLQTEFAVKKMLMHIPTRFYYSYYCLLKYVIRRLDNKAISKYQ